MSTRPSRVGRQKGTQVHPGFRTRYDRIVNRQTGKTVLIPFDHGLPFGALPGAEDPRLVARWAADGGADGIIFNQGLATVLASESRPGLAAIHMLTNSCTVEHAALFGSVARALKWAADAVALEILVGADTERQMIEQVAPILDACTEWNMPSLFMMYPSAGFSERVGRAEAVCRAARAGAELGASIVKTAWPGSKEAMARVVDSCPVPLVIAGGSQTSLSETFQRVRDAIDVGVAGVALGRNVWSAPQPVKMIQALCALVHQDAAVPEVLALLE